MERHGRSSLARGLLSRGSPAHLPGDLRARRRQSALRFRHAVGAPQGTRPAGRGGRAGLSRQPGQRHAQRGERDGLRRHRARARGAARPDRCRWRHRRTGLSRRRPQLCRVARHGRAEGLRAAQPRRARTFQLLRDAGADGHAGAEDRLPAPEPQRPCRSVDRLQRSRCEDHGPASGRPDDPRRSSLDGQDQLCAQRRRARGALREEAGRRVQHGNVGNAARDADDRVRRPLRDREMWSAPVHEFVRAGALR